MFDVIQRFLWIIVVLIFGIISCDQVNDDVDVTYLITDSDSGFDVRYRDAEDDLVFEKVETSSESDIWKYTFPAEAGDILFIAANYYDVNSKIRIRILLDNKIFREASSHYDTVNFVVVSGTVPF